MWQSQLICSFSTGWDEEAWIMSKTQYSISVAAGGPAVIMQTYSGGQPAIAITINTDRTRTLKLGELTIQPYNNNAYK